MVCHHFFSRFHRIVVHAIWNEAVALLWAGNVLASPDGTDAIVEKAAQKDDTDSIAWKGERKNSELYKNKAKLRPISAPRLIKDLWMNVFDEWLNEWKWMWYGMKGDRNEEIRNNQPFCAFQTFALTYYRSVRTHLKMTFLHVLFSLLWIFFLSLVHPSLCSLVL